MECVRASRAATLLALLYQSLIHKYLLNLRGKLYDVRRMIGEAKIVQCDVLGEH
jgi:hypothetical protein